MTNKPDQSKLFKYFFIVTTFLLLIALAIDKYISFEKPELKKKYISVAEADSLFRQALLNYSIDEKFLTIKRNNKNPQDSTYLVKVYSDVPVPLILLELENLFAPTKAIIQSEEENIGGKTLTKILLDEETLLKAEFIIDRNISRAKGRIGFVIYNIDYNSDNTALLKTPETIIFLLSPDDKSKNFIKEITNAGKRYAILLDNNITDLNFKLDEKYSVKRNKKSFENLFKYYPSAAFIVIDDYSDLFNSSAKDFFIKELEWRKAFYVKLSRFDRIDSFSSDPESGFNELIKNINRNESRIVLIDAKSFNQILPIIPAYRKIGYKFVSATELLK